MILSFIEGLIRNFSGSIGLVIRRCYYRMRLEKCGRNISIGENVFFDNPGDIEIGDNVWVDRNSILIAGKARRSDNNSIKGVFNNELEGKIFIGSNCHIGIGTIIQGHGGIRIGNNFTSSPSCKIYSMSNDPTNCHSGTVASENYIPACILSQVIIEDNVWLGINVSIFGGEIGRNCFIKSNSIITSGMIDENTVAEGSPAIKVKDRFKREG